MAENEQRSVRLQVATARDPDVGKGVARVARVAFEALGIREGDVIEIRDSLKYEGPRGQRRIGFTIEQERAAAD